MFEHKEIVAASRLVYSSMDPTPQIAWPILEKETGARVWVKHENHTPTGAFKVRGGITFIDWLVRTDPDTPGIVTATRGNHGQSIARAAVRAGLIAKIIVPHGNSVEKNAAMRAFGADLIEFGEDFDESRMEAEWISSGEGLHLVPPFHEELVRGVATYALELFSAVQGLDVVYVPIGCGSGICGVISVRDALGLDTEIVGVVSENAQTAKLSVEAGRLIETNTASTFADGIAVRVPVREAFEIYSAGASRIVSVSEEKIADAVRLLYRATHNLAEGAGAASLAALLQERDHLSGRSAGVIMSGGNIDAPWLSRILAGGIPDAK